MAETVEAPSGKEEEGTDGGDKKVEASPIKDGLEQQLAKDHSKDGEESEQEEETDPEQEKPKPEQEKEKPKPKLKDCDKEDRVTDGCKLRVRATEADLESHINADAAATIKQDHADDHVGGGDEDGVVDQKEGCQLQHQQDLRPPWPPRSDHDQV